MAEQSLAFPLQIYDPTNDLLYTGARRPLSEQSNVAVGNSKTLTVPANTIWLVRSIRVLYTSTAGAGNRQLVLNILDAAATNVVQSITAGAVQAAGLTRGYNFAPGNPRETVFIVNELMANLAPELLLPATWAVQLLDSANIDVLDTLVVRMLVEAFVPD